MNFRRRLTVPPKPFWLAFSGGVLGASLVLGLLSIPSLKEAILKTQAGDWIQSISTIVGVAITIGATLWLENRRRVTKHVEDQRLLREALGMLSSKVAMIKSQLLDGVSHDDQVVLTAGQYELLRLGRRSLSYARDGYRISGYNLWTALEAIDGVFVRAQKRLEHEEGILRDPRMNVTPAVLEISREHLSKVANDLAQPVAAALVAVDGQPA